jgi:hypothetical protein
MPGGPGSSTLLIYSATHKNVNNLGATHKSGTFTVNTRAFRKGCLIFWKLRRPNLILKACPALQPGAVEKDVGVQSLS